MASRLSRAWFARTAVAVAALVVPLLAAGSAQAALAGATPEKTANRPDLISATILTGGPGGGGSVDYCFDKTISNPAGGFVSGDFLVGGYRATNAYASGQHGAPNPQVEQLSSSNTPPFNCVRAFFDSGVGDLNVYTVGTVLANAVTSVGGANSGGNNNDYGDSAPLTGSVTHNGTTGFNTAPDLTGVLVDSTSNTITYVMDQNIGTANITTTKSGGPNDTGGFNFTDAAGNTCYAPTQPGVINGQQITVSFTGAVCYANITNGSTITTEAVSNAVRAGDLPDTVTAEADPNSSNTEDEVPVSGTGTTAKPDLTKTVLESNGQAIDFTFDDNVGPDFADCFEADLSTGDQIEGQNASVISVSQTSTTIRVVFPNLTYYDEYVVKGSVFDACAVFSSTGSSSYAYNTPGSTPAGGNNGAFARGFTTGPDAFAAVLHTSTGVADIALDQRAFYYNGGGAAAPDGHIALLDGNGNVIATANGSAIGFPAQAAGPETITAQFTPAEVSVAKNIMIENNNTAAPTVGGAALSTNIQSANASGTYCYNVGNGTDGCSDQPNVDQILSTTTTSALTKVGRLASAKVAHSRAAKARAKRAAAHRLARLRAAEKARLHRLARRQH